MNIRLLLKLINHSVQEFLIERSTACITFLFGLAFFSLEIVAGIVFFEHTDTMLGWNKLDYMLLIATASTISFLYQTLFVVSHENLAEAIIKGELDYTLIRPVSSIFYYSLYRIDIPSFLNVVVSVGLQVFLLRHYKIILLDIVLYIASILLTTYLLFLLNHIAVCVSFWIEGSSSVQGVPEYLFEFSSRPLVIYPDAVRFIFTWIVPILIGINLPVLIIRKENWIFPFLFVLLFDVGGTVLGYIVWQKGIKKYVSAS